MWATRRERCTISYTECCVNNVRKRRAFMVVESVKKVKNIVSEVFKGYASNSSGGCCGVSLPPEEQRQLKRLKEGAQAEKKD